MIWVGPAHTRGDTVFFVEGDKVLFSGDVAMSHAVPALTSPSSTARSWLAALDRLDPLRPVRIVPSHGPMGDASLIEADRRFLKALEARVQELKAQGKSSDETAQVLGAEFQAEYPDWTAPARIGVAVKAIFADTR